MVCSLQELNTEFGKSTKVNVSLQKAENRIGDSINALYLLSNPKVVNINSDSAGGVFQMQNNQNDANFFTHLGWS